MEINKENPSVFEYLDFSKYLKDIYKFKKNKNNLYTRNGFSRSLGYETSSYVNQVMLKQRKPNIKLVNRVATCLSLSQNEIFYLTMLMLRSHIEKENNFLKDFYDRYILKKIFNDL